MNAQPKQHIFLRILVSLMVSGLFAVLPVSGPATAQDLTNDILYTTDADFDRGTLVSVNHNAPNNDQLQLDSQIKPFPFINVAASGRGTVVRTNTETGEITGEYRTAPEGRGLNPSRTTVDLFGNVWTANRDEVGEIDGVPHGSTVKIGLIVGGTRVNDDGSPNPDGGYLAPPFGYNTCVDRNGDGLIRTSKGLGDILDWPDVTDGLGGTDGLVQDAVDECILVYQRLSDAEQARHVSVDAENNVWVGGYPFVLRMVYKLNGTTGAILDSFDARKIGCGGYGGLVDGNGILWSVGGALLRYDPVARTGKCIQQYGYGLGIDTNGYIWMSLWDGGVVKIAPDGTVVPGFPKPTFPSSMTTLSMAERMEDLTAIPQNAPAGNASDSRPAGDGIKSLKLPPTEFANRQTQPVQNVIFPTENDAQAFNEPLAEDPSVTFQVAPVDNWVASSSPWTPNATISLTIEDGGFVVYSNSQKADAGGNFKFNLWDLFDLQRGQVVTVSDGTTTKSHTVMPLYVDGVNVANDTIFGRAQASANVDIWVHGDGNLNVTPDSSGNWTADFSSQTDLTYLSDGGSQQFDSDGDSTGVWWSSPRIEVSPQDNWVQSWSRWKPGVTVTLTIEDGGVAVYSDSQTTDAHGNFHFNLWDVFDLQRGQVVTVSDGTTTKTHTVLPLFVDEVDLAADTVSGRAKTGLDVEVWVNGDGWMAVTPDGSGNWAADFSGQTDLTWLTDGGSRQVDEDGDTTHVSWSSPRFWVAPDDNWVQSRSSWTPGATITLTIEEGGEVVYSDAQVADMEGYFNFNLWNDGFDLQRSHVVTVSDGITTKSHAVMPLFVDEVDVAADSLSGRGEAGTDVEIWVHGDGNLIVTPDGSGNWTADFSAQTDLTYADDGGSAQYDTDGDGTGVWWAPPRFQVAPDDDWVQSWRPWRPGTTITLTIEDHGVEVYSDSQATDTSGNFNFNLWDVFDLKRGQVVTVSDGTTTKTHTVMPLYVDSVDVAADKLFGRAQTGTQVDVWVHGDGNLTITPDGSGNWTADFSAQTDLTYLNDGGSQQIDEDGDATGVWWSSPSFHVSPDDNWIQQWNRWTPGATIALTIEDGGAVVFTDSQTADTHGNFNFSNLWPVDLDTGQVVTVSDGRTTKTHVVADFTVTDIDTGTDRVYGAGGPGARVWVWAYSFNDSSGRWATADSTGKWMVDFSVGSDGQPVYNITDQTRIDVDEFDDDGDSTWRRFGAPVQGSTGVAVTPADNNVWVANRNSGTVTRLDNDGNVLKMIPTGEIPTGVAVDAAGKVWATNLGSDNAVRIDPNADGLGAVDLTVDLGPGASPYNYSDMTGTVVVGSTSPQGIWTVVQDSQTAGFEWGRILWNTEPQGSEPPGTAIIVEARAADTQAGLGGQTFQPVAKGALFSMFGRFIEVRVTLKASPEGASPVLSDIRIQPHVIYADIDIKPGSYPNAINCRDKKEVVTVAILTTKDFNALTVDYRTVTFEGTRELHVDKRTGLPVRHVEDIGLDGDLDLVFHFYMRNTTLTCASTTGKLIGLTYDGIPIEGTDSIWMVTR